MSAMTLLSVSCSKDSLTPGSVTDGKTLEQTYPDWKNLTWVSTDGSTSVDKYPKLSISISGDIITVFQPVVDANHSYTGKYDKITISGNTTVLFYHATNQAPDVTGTFTNNGTQITLTTKGLSTTSNVYVLEIKKQ